MLKADLDIDLLRDRQGVLYLNAEVSDGARELGVAEQELDRGYCSFVGRSASAWFGARKGSRRLKGSSPIVRPPVDQPCILAGRNASLRVHVAWKQRPSLAAAQLMQPSQDRRPRLVGELEGNRFSGLLLNNRDQRPERATQENVL